MENINSVNEIQKNLLIWFSLNGRHWIPWKLKSDGSLPQSGEFISPYGVWIAEVMLQQTQLNVVIPYWQNWMQTFPFLVDLVEADEQKVLLKWQGLGYYSRAKRLYQSSKLLLNQIDINNIADPRSWPVEIDEWIALPGIGRSTAGSIISSAFDLPAPILDGNVKRIISRLLAIEGKSSKDQKKLWGFSTFLSVKSPRNINQALMDLGSKVCTSRNPTCSICPLKKNCIAYLRYDPIYFPKKGMQKSSPREEIGIGLVFNKDGEVLIDQRRESSSMGGMWEFPGGKKEAAESIEETIEREVKEEIGINVKTREKLLAFDHAYSHKKLSFTVYICDFKSGDPKPLASQRLLWVSPQRLFDFPFPAANTKIIVELHKYLGI